MTHTAASDGPELARAAATHRLAVMGQQHPQLHRAAADARLDLAAAIIAMDDAEGAPGRHNLNEQAAVERALQAYAHALANQLRGEHS